MKTIIFSFFALILAMTSVTAHASGKITIQNNFYETSKGGHEYKPMIGFQIYEWLISKKAALNSWTGYGSQALELSPDVEWLTSKNQVDLFAGKFIVSPGFQYSYIPTFSDHRFMPYLKLDFKLW